MAGQGRAGHGSAAHRQRSHQVPTQSPVPSTQHPTAQQRPRIINRIRSPIRNSATEGRAGQRPLRASELRCNVSIPPWAALVCTAAYTDINNLRPRTRRNGSKTPSSSHARHCSQLRRTSCHFGSSPYIVRPIRGAIDRCGLYSSRLSISVQLLRRTAYM